MTEGSCLCGEVSVNVEELPQLISACHCEMCRKHFGSVGMGIEVPRDQVTVEGPVKLYESSSFAERAFCGTCGSTLFVQDKGAKNVELAPGLFPEAGGAKLFREVYADRAPRGCSFAGNHARVARMAYEATNKSVPEDEI